MGTNWRAYSGFTEGQSKGAGMGATFIFGGGRWRFLLRNTFVQLVWIPHERQNLRLYPWVKPFDLIMWHGIGFDFDR